MQLLIKLSQNPNFHHSSCQSYSLLGNDRLFFNIEDPWFVLHLISTDVEEAKRNVKSGSYSICCLKVSKKPENPELQKSLGVIASCLNYIGNSLEGRIYRIATSTFDV
ncbi:hypothetical protein L1987_09889 [Smallanthus sonchifolius]|uniref:Uncharacterized protein n=1 Tax=Smallanthus sonchifolius TaxID=185202 RepID=A0ACB9JQK0_9ASTR|nr:hypothetical protein L1987_09889 [Smallanthus sonchifolius]